MTKRSTSPAPRLLALLLWLLQPWSQALAATVTNTSDSGAGSFREAVAASNGGSITWTSGSGGILTLLSSIPSLSGGTILDASASGSDLTIAGSPNAIPLGGVVTINNSTAQGFTISAIISGSGSLTKGGAGDLHLSGINTYSGGTTLNAGTLSIDGDVALGDSSGGITINGGTLRTLSSLSSERSVTLNGAAAFDTTSTTSTFSGAFSGSGSLTKLGAGTLQLSGTNTYGGGTTISAGVLSINAASALGSGALTMSGGTLRMDNSLSDSRGITLAAGGGGFDTAGTTSTLSGLISGAGSLTKLSSGTLVLSGTNVYLGGTSVRGGVLAVSADANLGDASGAVTLDGGALRTDASFDSARTLTLGAAGGTLDTYGHNIGLSGTISGAGSLTKAGEGILTLSGLNTYTGGTSVLAGQLRAGRDNALPTGGALSIASGAGYDLNEFSQTSTLGAVTNNGTINVGRGTLTLNNGYQGSGAISLVLQTGVTNITGSVLDLSGGTLSVSLANPLVVSGQTFTPITAGTVTGEFTRVYSSPAVAFVPTYDGSSVLLTAELVPFSSLGASSNQREIGSGLEGMRANPTGDAATVLTALYSIDQSQLQAAFDSIGPASYGSLGGIGLAGLGVQTAALNQRFTAMRTTSRMEETFESRAPKSPYPGTLYASAGFADVTPRYYTNTGGPDTPWGFFVSAAAGKGWVGGSNGASGYSTKSGGMLAGGDYAVTEGLAVGLAGGYTRGQAVVWSGGGVDQNNANLGAYLIAHGESFQGNLYAGRAEDFFSVRREVEFPGVSRTALSKPRGHETNLSTDWEFDAKTHNHGTMSPFASLSYQNLAVDGFEETGADSLNLSVDGQTIQSLRSTIGLKNSEVSGGSSYLVATTFSAGWRHEYMDQGHQIGSRLASGSGSTFQVDSKGIPDDGLVLGARVGIYWTKQSGVTINYSGDFRPAYRQHLLDLAYRYRF